MATRWRTPRQAARAAARVLSAARDRWRHRRDDAGSVLVVVLVISFVVVTGAMAALTTSSSNIQQAGAYGTTTSARLAAESGIQATLVSMEAAGTVAALPCASSAPVPVGARSAYVAAIAYLAGATPLGGCPLDPLGLVVTQATITSTGTSGSASVTMRATVAVSNVPPTYAGYHYAVNAGAGGATLQGGEYQDGGNTPNGVSAQGSIVCSGDGWIFANVQSDVGVTGCHVEGATTQPSGSAFPAPLTESQLASSSNWPGDVYVKIPASLCGSDTTSSDGSYGNAAASWFANEVQKATATTVIDATYCSSGLTLQGVSSDGGSCSTYSVSQDVVLLASSVTVSGCNDFGSPSGSHSLSILGLSSSGSAGSVDVSGTNRFDWNPIDPTSSSSNLNLLVYSPGQVDFSCGGHVTGQILGGKGVSTSGGFTLSGSDNGANPIPQAHEPSGITVTLTSEVLLSD